MLLTFCSNFGASVLDSSSDNTLGSWRSIVMPPLVHPAPFSLCHRGIKQVRNPFYVVVHLCVLVWVLILWATSGWQTSVLTWTIIEVDRGAVSGEWSLVMNLCEHKSLLLFVPYFRGFYQYKVAHHLGLTRYFSSPFVDAYYDYK